MTKLNAVLVCALALAACGRQEAAPEANNAATEVPPPPARPIEPGLYRQATTLLEMKDPGLSQAEADAAAKQIGTTQTEESCVTADMVGDPKALIESDIAEDCVMERTVWDGGKIDIALSCPATADSSGGKLALTGDYDGDRYSITMAMSGNNGEVVRMKVDATRLGECRG